MDFFLFLSSILLLILFLFIGIIKKESIYKYYIKEYWMRSFDFNGKTNGKLFWRIILIGYPIGLLIGLLIHSVFFGFINYGFYYIDYYEYFLNNEEVNQILYVPIIYFFINIIPTLSIQIRRLNDIKKSRLFFLLHFIPVIGLSTLLLLYTYPSA